MYSIYVVLEVDVSELTDDELYWLLKEDLDVSVYVKSEDNRLDLKSLARLGTLQYSYEDDTPYRLYLVFWDLSSYRFSFSGADLSIRFTARQLEKYEYTNSEGKKTMRNKREDFHYSATIGENLESVETIGEPLYDFMLEWLKDRRDFYSSLLD